MRPATQGLMGGALAEYFAAEGLLVEKNADDQFASHDDVLCVCLKTSVPKCEAGVCHIGQLIATPLGENLKVFSRGEFNDLISEIVVDDDLPTGDVIADIARVSDGLLKALDRRTI